MYFGNKDIIAGFQMRFGKEKKPVFRFSPKYRLNF